MDADPSTGFAKLNFLIANPPCPPETFGNLLLLYCKYACYALAADIMAEYTHLHEAALSQVSQSQFVCCVFLIVSGCLHQSECFFLCVSVCLFMCVFI